jgi:hypothetical protein
MLESQVLNTGAGFGQAQNRIPYLGLHNAQDFSYLSKVNIYKYKAKLH